MFFEKRLGGHLMRPIGKKWHALGMWKVHDHPATVEQYLGIGGATPDDTPRLNEVLKSSGDGLYFCKDIASDEKNTAITFDRFMQSKIDFVIASLPQHIRPFFRLCQEHPSQPKLIYQIGNAWNIPPAEEKFIDGILASARLMRKPTVPYIEYHQEFDLDIFNPHDGWETPHTKWVSSFVNCFNTASIFMFDWKLFEAVEKLMPDWTFNALGGSCRDGCAHGAQEVANEMRKARFIWHTKAGGDGYGHVIHNTAAVGRPTITRKSYYYGKMAEDLMIDGETCIAIDGLGAKEIKNKILYYNDDRRYSKLCQNVYNNFKAHINFDKEAEEIKTLLAQIDHGQSNRRFSDIST